MAKLTNDDKLDIIIQYEDGIRPAKIAMQYKVNVSTIGRLVRRYREHGIDAIQVKYTHKVYDEEFKNKVLEQVDNGEPFGVVARRNNIEHSMIKTWMKQRNERKKKMLYNNLIEGISDTMSDKEIKYEELLKELSDEERKELIELRKRNKELEMEVDLLKKLKALIQQREKK